MSTRLEQLTARRRLLQLQCAVQRGEIGETQAQIDAGAARVDRVIAVVRRFGPLLVAVGVVAAVAIGPSRLLGVTRQALTLGLFAGRAARLLR
jgi:hypothetical protein